ncbi:MAG TPA: ParB N-terminal domain-containing protein, partial [Ktedonobacteraceae bacterium]|nr:ParB N-terminal domain-containing protein [Ktedonobacteraceae bacterium]
MTERQFNYPQRKRSENQGVTPIKENRVVQIANLAPHPRNYRVHPQHQIDKLVLSLQRFGQGRSIVVQDSPEHMIIVAGHGIVEAAQALKWQELRADILPADWTDQQIEGYLIADNLHSQEASDNEELLAMLLQEQLDSGFDLRSLGTDDETLRQMLEATGDGYLAGEQEDEYSEDEEDLSAEDTIYSNEAIASEAFKHFRNIGFPYRNMPVYMCMQELNKLNGLEGDSPINSRLGYHIADTYHPHRLHASAESMKSPYEAFHDDKLLARVFHLQQENMRSIPLDILGVLYIVSGTQACANFRPGFAMYLYRKYCKPGAVVLDSSTGYGGRLVGFIASGLAGKYIGIDPNTKTYNANVRMA